MTHPLAHRLSDMLGGDAGVGCVPITGNEGLYPGETLAIARAIPKRQAEFAAGRRAARAALAAFDHPATAIPVGDRRAPVWPEGIVGTITHDRGYALAAVLPADAALGVGIDLTEAAPLPGQTRTEILPFETEAGFDDLTARAGFSAKESLFKALFPSIRDYFGFSSAMVAPDLGAGRFKITLTRPLGPFPAGQTWQGDMAEHSGLFLTALRIAPKS